MAVRQQRLFLPPGFSRNDSTNQKTVSIFRDHLSDSHQVNVLIVFLASNNLKISFMCIQNAAFCFVWFS